MKKYILFIATFALAAFATSASAQALNSERSMAQGALMNRDLMSFADLGNFTLSQAQFGTARATGLAGAVSSLGGDASSIISNPAGLGMYRTNEITFTPSLSSSRSSSSASGKDGAAYGSDLRRPFSISNLATVFNVYENSNTFLTSLNLAFGYTRAADFNQNFSLSKTNMDSSIANIFARQLSAAGIPQSSLAGDDNPNWNSLATNNWAAALAYKAFMADQIAQNGDNPIWGVNALAAGARMAQMYSYETSGGINEYSFALGGNLGNKLYFGVTFSLLDVSHDANIIYEEVYSDNPLGASADAVALRSSYYSQRIITEGIGGNIKLGLTYRPLEDLRLAFAYHSPDWYSTDRDYQSSVGSHIVSRNESGQIQDYFQAEDSPLLEDYGENAWNYRSGSKIILGASWTFLNRGLISVDYEHEWFSGAKISKTPIGLDPSMFSASSDIFDNVSTLRLGAEYKLSPRFALRAGLGTMNNSKSNANLSSELLNIPMITGQDYFSAGFGFAISAGFNVDFAYLNSKTEYSNYALFKSEGTLDDLSPSAESASSSNISSSLKENRFMLTFAFKM